mmetsp:Transcript_102176/g.124994  ORF Transcript_102176/g.124994 Transcript_102176/m.124994 type:complete len:181 (+) Transcript_102176:260-802(+)
MPQAIDPKFGKCCGIIPARSGIMIIGCYGGVLNIFNIVTLSMGVNILEPDGELSALIYVDIVIHVILLLIGVPSAIYGAYKGNTNALGIYLVVAVVILFIYVITFFTFFVPATIVQLIWIYFIYVIYKYRKTLLLMPTQPPQHVSGAAQPVIGASSNNPNAQLIPLNNSNNYKTATEKNV